ncbi:MAG: DUF192 domain-containing protein [Calditrichaeota bacterium]|nr:MAG: DUF192 domain-containing protein [Calditrichota bacterium]MBL1204493.1 DUF192 domain-containing protein [Calditrichota bacterium]NOG44322.1 DUF192 domain-containing protein [Calditrichota bacterium]
MKIVDPKKAAKKSRRMSMLDMIIIFSVVIGMSMFYKLSVNRTLSIQKDVQENNPQKTKLKQGRVVFYDSSNKKKLEVLVEIAENEYQQSKGFMFREDIPENQGMLFTYEDELQRFFWMKETPVSLDIIFIDATYKIVKIHKDTVPHSENLYPSGIPAQFVVEVRAGFTDRYQIDVGDNISWERL